MAVRSVPGVVDRVSLMGEGTLGLFARSVILIVVNIAVVAILYLAQNLYNVVEKLMKLFTEMKHWGRSQS